MRVWPIFLGLEYFFKYNTIIKYLIPQVIVTQMHGTEALVHALINAGDREEITDPAVCALRHLTSRHPQAEKARNAIRTHNGITALATILKPSSISQQSLVKV